MTSNQLKYAQIQEDRRHNREQELLSKYANESGRIQAHASAQQAGAATVQAAVAQQRVSEEARHNKAYEDVTRRGQNMKLAGEGIGSAVRLVDTMTKLF